MPLTPQDVDALFVRSTLDHEIIVGSEVRMLCGALRSAWQERDHWKDTALTIQTNLAETHKNEKRAEWRRGHSEAFEDAATAYEAKLATAEARAETALSSASATEAALRDQIEHEGCAVSRLGERTYSCSVDRLCGLCRLRLRATAAESREAALRGERDEACEALEKIVRTRKEWAPFPQDCNGYLARDIEAARAVLARIRKGTDHE